jgi:hypothetical protein
MSPRAADAVTDFDLSHELLAGVVDNRKQPDPKKTFTPRMNTNTHVPDGKAVDIDALDDD